MKKSKNVVIETTLEDYKVIKHHDITVTILKFKNEEKVITGLFVDEYKDLTKNKKYKVRGNIVSVKDIDIIDFNNIINGDIKKYIDNDNLLCITAIEKINEYPLLTSIEFSIFHNITGNLIDLKVPVSAVEVLEIDNISETISYSGHGKCDRIPTCGNLALRLKIDELDKDTTKTLLEDICLFYISLFFEDGKEEYYNLPFNSKDDEKNDLQIIDKLDNKIIIRVSNDFKFQKR